jgi:transaldolase
VTKMNQLADLGQAVWLDYIRRSFTRSGELRTLVEQGLRGVTSNPSIFQQAIAKSTDYDDALQELMEKGNYVDVIYEELVLEDIRDAADILEPVYENTSGADGFVSLEVNPDLARDTKSTIAEARRLWSAIERPNVMIKVPSTDQGIAALRRLISEGINVNATLMFSLTHYERIANAYLTGLEDRASEGGDLSHVASVASFFVSRVDGKVDAALEEIGEDSLQGKIGIANSKVAYAHFADILASKRWQSLADQGARPQRVLWASTSTKNPSYPDTMYVDELIGEHTVNTMPRETLVAFLDHGTVDVTVTTDVDQAREQLERLAELGIDLDVITEELQNEGVDAFAKAHSELMSCLADRIKERRVSSCEE